MKKDGLIFSFSMTPPLAGKAESYARFTTSGSASGYYLGFSVTFYFGIGGS